MSSIAGIHVMSGGAPKEVFALLAPKFEQQTGNKVKFTYASLRNYGKNWAQGRRPTYWCCQGRADKLKLQLIPDSERTRVANHRVRQ
jgi:hypothetical protein